MSSRKNHDKIPMIQEYRFSKKHMSSIPRENPKKVIPSRFVVIVNGEKIVLSYHSLILEGPKSLVCRYTNKYPDRNALPSRVIVKYQLKFQGCAWSHRLKQNIVKRYLDVDKGDVLCTTLAPSDRLCSYFGTYILVADPRRESPDRWEVYSNTPGVPELGDSPCDEAFVIQIFDEIKGCDMYSFISEDGPSDICSTENRENLRTCLQIMADIFEGVNLMHKQRIYHGDLKPENVMLSNSLGKGEHSKIGGNIRASIIDFDFSARIEDERIKRGTPRYLSPEYLQAYRGHIELSSLGILGRQFDIWAIGAIMWTIFFGGRRGEKLYFTSYSTDQLKNPAMTSKVIQAMISESSYQRFLMKRLGKPGPEGSVRESVRLLLIEVLAHDPRERPTASNCLRRIREIQSSVSNYGPSNALPLGPTVQSTVCTQSDSQ
eukprot:GHVH01003652.1.p1 GENE.GHVH01003652.1~~GHVH01003652.1.p1  ORF type:complete len:432 (-),score=61.88 GHVH01003652.1:103-1398(-)